MKYECWQDVVIVGAGGYTAEVYSYIEDLRAQGRMISIVGMLDEGKTARRSERTKIIGSLSELAALLQSDPGGAVGYLAALEDNRQRFELVRRLEGLNTSNLSPWTLRHPRAIVGREVEIGGGTCVAPNSVLTANVRIGRHCLINVNATVSHSSQLGDFCSVGAGAGIANNVRLGTGCTVGAGATVIEQVTIGDWAIIGAGAVVVEDIPPHVTVVGVPAKVIKRNA
jgi:acetyltransferase EpsM